MQEHFNKITAVITGGAGFIGSNIAEELVRKDWKVIILDDLSTGKIENIKNLISSQRVEFIQDSITNINLLKSLFSGVDYVFHEAAIASVPSSIDNPILSHEINITGTLNVLVAARDNCVKKVVFASSSAIYGLEPTLPKREDMLPDPQSPYAINKLSSEYYCQMFNTIYHLPTICLRYFNVYGSRQNPNSQYAAVIPKFIQLVSEGKSPIIYGDGNQTRDFVFISDVVSANLLAAESSATGVYNIGSGECVSLNQLVYILLHIMGKDDLKPIYEKERVGDVKYSVSDIKGARLFGYTPNYSLQAGLVELLKEKGLLLVSPFA